MLCWHCQKPIEVTDSKISFRTICENCGSWQHACVNCQHYKVGFPNQCAIPETEFVNDREKFNFCEDFSLLAGKKEATNDRTSIEKKLFGDSLDQESSERDAGDRFRSLFEDD